MRTMVPTVAGLLTLAAVSAQAAPLPPAKASPTEVRAAPPIELVRQGCGWGWHRRSLAGPLGLLVLGALLSELVTSAGRCDCAHRNAQLVIYKNRGSGSNGTFKAARTFFTQAGPGRWELVMPTSTRGEFILPEDEEA
jgi:hypothetical protein